MRFSYDLILNFSANNGFNKKDKLENFQQSILNFRANNANYVWGLVGMLHNLQWPASIVHLLLFEMRIIDCCLDWQMVSKGEIFWGLCLQISWPKTKEMSISVIIIEGSHWLLFDFIKMTPEAGILVIIVFAD